MRIATVTAEQVRPGDYLFNNLATHPVFQWCRVLQVGAELRPRSFDPADGSYRAVTITTGAWTTWKHPCEGVMIRRAIPCSNG